MDAGTKFPTKEEPAQVYAVQLKRLWLVQGSEQRREKLLGYGKVLIALLTLVCAAIFIRQFAILELLIVPIVLFIFLAATHEKVLRSIHVRLRAIDFYERGLARVEDRWAGTGETGERFLDPAHPYARDLDLFGHASLFELLCTARTRAGEETLSAWLLAAAPVEEIHARQNAVRDLQGRVEFREKLFTPGQTVRAGVQPGKLAAWGERGSVFTGRATRIATSVLGVVWIAGMVCWGLWGFGRVALAVTVLNLAWAHRLHARLDQASDAVEEAAEDLELLAGVLQLLESETFLSPKLVGLQDALRHDGVEPSVAIRKLARIVSYLQSRRNPAARLLDVLTFWSAQFVFMAERWQLEFGPEIRKWMSAIGEMEALTALSGYAYENPRDVFPEFVEHGPTFDAEGLAHPLLPVSTAVRNDVKLGDERQLIILSGPNMAGKSTFIRAVGVGTVMAQCGAPVRATKLTLSPLNVAASICILDSLSGGVSRFYAEIHRLKLATDLANGPIPILFLLDELLSGTNSNDRLAGTQLVVRTLMNRHAIGIVSTHDLALTQIPQTLGDRAVNCHFEDQLDGNKLIFDYKLKPGIVQASNALELMRSIGLGGDGESN